MICPYSSFIFCPCLAFWIVPILKKLSSGFTFEVLIILICRKGCDRICLSAKQGRWCPQPLRAMCFYNKSKWKKKKKGSFAFNIINRNPTKYYLNHYAHTVAALLVLSAVFLGSLITSGKKKSLTFSVVSAISHRCFHHFLPSLIYVRAQN